MQAACSALELRSAAGRLRTRVMPPRVGREGRHVRNYFEVVGGMAVEYVIGDERIQFA